MASVAEIAPLNTEFDVPTGTPKGFKSAVEEIAQVIFQKTKISLEGSAKAVMPSIPIMLSEIADDIREGSVDKFKISLDKLERITSKLGVDLGKYNKELADFLKDRQENTIKSEQRIIEIREKGAKAEIDEITGKINVLSREEIKQRTDTLKQTLVSQKKITKEKDKEEKRLQKSRFLDEAEIETKKQFVSESYEQLQILEQQKQELMNTLNIKNEEDLPGTGFMGMSRSRDSGGGGEGIRDYTPDFIMQFFDGIKDQLMGFIEPFIIMKDVVFQLLKPLKLLGKLFKPLITGMGKLIKSIGRQILVGLALVAVNLLRILTDKKVLIGLAAIAAIVGIKKGIDKIKENAPPSVPGDGTAGGDAEASMDNVGDTETDEELHKKYDNPYSIFRKRKIESRDPATVKAMTSDDAYKLNMNDRVEGNQILKTENMTDSASSAIAVNNSNSMVQNANTSSPTTVIASSVNQSKFADSIDDVA